MAAGEAIEAQILKIHTSRGGLPKFPVAEAVVHRLGIEGDAVAHPKFHGGPLQALLLITEEGIEELKAKGYPLFPGAMGENITTRGLDRRQMRIGQRYRIGRIVVQLTKLRVPCAALHVYGPSIKREVYDAAAKSGDPKTPVWGLSGFYASVSEGGVIQEHDIIKLLDHDV
ncbi:MAG: MOSC domain-containing protein [Bryobacteraceae bacterium]